MLSHATLSASSMASIVSRDGLSDGLISAAAAIAVRAVVALIPIEFLLIIGTRPISRPKTTVDLSVSFIKSLKHCVVGSTVGGGDLSKRDCVFYPPAGSHLRGWRLRVSLGSKELQLLGTLPSDTICDTGFGSMSISESERPLAEPATVPFPFP